MTTRSIYFAEGVFERVEAEAKRVGMSFNKYVVESCDPLGKFFEGGQLDRIEGKLDKLLGSPVGLGAEYSRVKKAEPVEEDPDGIKMLAAKQAEIDSIKARKIAKVKDKIRPDAEVVGAVVNQLGQIRRPMPKGTFKKS